MPRRSPGARGGLNSAVFSLLFAVPLIAAAQQQPSHEIRQRHGYHGSPREESLLDTYAPHLRDDQTTTSSSSSALSGANVQTTRKRGKHTDTLSKNERALATLAPAESGSAVRAPRSAARSGSGLSGGRHRPRSLRDWEVEDFVLLATVDGTIHARRRDNGAHVWALEADRPMVETVYHPKNSSGREDEGAFQEDFYWIVEPSQNGELYVFIPGPDAGMQKLGLNVKNLTDLSPYKSDDPPVVYTAEKRNTLYTVNARTGDLLDVYNSAGPSSPNLGSCKPVSSLRPLEDDGCDRETTATIELGRTEYTITIVQNGVADPAVCTIRYFEWTPNTRDRDLHSQYSTSVDNKYVYSQHDGHIYALERPGDGSSPKWRGYRQEFSSPVVRVFDVVRPANSELQDAPLVLLPQPVGPAFDEDETEDVFVNCTEAGSLYAMSELQYPTVTARAAQARCYWEQKTIDWDESYIVPEKSALVGVHSLAETVERSTGFPSISAPEQFPPLVVEPPETTATERPQLDGPQGQTPWLSVSTLQTLLLLFLVGGCGFVYVDPKLKKSSIPFLNKALFKREIPVSQLVSETKPEVLTEEPVVENIEDPSTRRTDERHVTFDVPEAESRSRRESESSSVDAQDPAAEHNVNGNAAENSLATAPETGVDGEPKKKKAHRGQRGRGGRGRKKKKAEEDVIANITNVPGPPQDGQIDPDEQTIITDGITGVASDHIQINNLLIRTDRVLGNGSGGTFVFEGSFEGRDVAVKRMLPQYFELASQEVDTLRQSDDHPNVIRYFCQQKDQNFLYIAVELCRASLWDLYKDGRQDEILTEEQTGLQLDISLNPKKVLYQLAAGLNHLHSLRIIHRDIKPQNILVAYPKKNSTTKAPRLVISDFGLCKTLPDNVSTLVGTTGNAGTVGWKAPELIFQPKDVDSGKTSSNSPQDTTNPNNSTSSNEGSPSSSSGVKRAIDIFSLGCVFYYVFTRGCHPFDDEEGWMQIRELNIKKNKLNLSGLFEEQEFTHLITWMLAHRPEHRPTAPQVMAHPFFWSAEKQLSFLCDASDHWEREPRDPPSVHLDVLEDFAPDAFPSGNFYKHLDQKFIDTLGKQRKYTTSRLLDLLRALRNKKNHYEDMPEDVKARVGALPDGYLKYWTSRFPGLLMAVYGAVTECGLDGADRFKAYFEAGDGR